MKKDFKIDRIHFLLSCLFAFCSLLLSCEKDDVGKNIRINSVWMNQYNSENEQITSSFLNVWVRLEGSNFTGLLELYCNGVKIPFSPVNVTDNYIVFHIPGDLPVGGDVVDRNALNVIRIRTKHGEATYPDFVFRDQNKIPSVSGVSSTMPFAGDVVTVKGINLQNAIEAYFPGDIKAEITAKNDSTVTLVVPGSVNRDVSGTIRLVIDGEDYSSPPFMYYKQGIFMRTTTQTDVPMSGGTGYLTYSGEAVKAQTGLANNPENVIVIPAAPKNIALGAGNDDKSNTGWLRFAMVNALKAVIDNPDNNITASTQMNNLAIQFELYMNQPWKSGALSYRMNLNNGGASSWTCYNFGWWASKGSPYDFNNQWQTVTIPLSYYKANSTGGSLGTLDSYLLENTNTNSALAFVNFFQGYQSLPLSKFQLFVANLRIVPMNNNM